MQTECTPKLFEFEAVGWRAVVAQFDGGTITSNAGALLLGKVNRGLGLTRRFAQCFTDRRDPRYVEHSVETLVGQLVFGLVLGCEDLNDHDELRKDPVFAVLAGKLKPVLRTDCAPVAGKSTLNRLEHTPKRDGAKYHKIDCSGDEVDALLVDVFVEAHKRPPRQIVLDLDATDISLHGHQEGRFFHGYYDNYCYLPLYVFCGRELLLAKLRRSNIDASAGAVEEIARIVAHIRRKWPRVRIMLRADSGFAREALMHWCETNGVDYVFGLARNKRLEEAIATQLSQTKRRCAATGKAVRLFRDFRYSTLDSWSQSVPSPTSLPQRIGSPGTRLVQNRFGGWTATHSFLCHNDWFALSIAYQEKPSPCSVRCNAAKRHADQGSNRRNTVDEFEPEIVVERRVDGIGRGCEQERVSVSGCSYDRFSSEIAAGTGSVLDNVRLAKPLGEPLPHETR
jgi:hypothetical protein